MGEEYEIRRYIQSISKVFSLGDRGDGVTLKHTAQPPLSDIITILKYL